MVRMADQKMKCYGQGRGHYYVKMTTLTSRPIHIAYNFSAHFDDIALLPLYLPVLVNLRCFQVSLYLLLY